MLSASNDETFTTKNGSPCSKNKEYDVNKIYKIVVGPHPGKRISLLNTSYDITSDGNEYCTSLSSIAFVYKCVSSMLYMLFFYLFYYDKLFVKYIKILK